MMIEITEDYTSYEVSKLLKEKGYKVPTEFVWYEKTPITVNINKAGIPSLDFFYITDDKELNVKYANGMIPDYIAGDVYSAPTLQKVRKWLRKKYNLEIAITYGFPLINNEPKFKYFWSIVHVKENRLEYPMDDPKTVDFNEETADTFEDAINDALIYILNNLI